MAKKKTDKNDKELSLKAKLTDPNAVDMPATDQSITEMLEINYMPYAMSVIVSRAIPEIDGFKPSHRKLLYTMYKMGLLNGNRTKSANVVGQTMQLNPHGDAAIYDTMVRLSKGYEALLHPLPLPLLQKLLWFPSIHKVPRPPHQTNRLQILYA